MFAEEGSFRWTGRIMHLVILPVLGLLLLGEASLL